jgi:cation:H+ antiporter
MGEDEQTVFEGILINAIILVVSLLVLAKASHLTITNSIRVANITGFGKTTIGFLLVAFLTSLPELLVSIIAAVSQAVTGQEAIGIAIGNVLGSNIINICLILGICILIASFINPKTTKLVPFMTKEEFGSLHFGLFLASIIPLTLLYIGYASRLIGMVLLAIFVIYTYQLSKVRNIKENGTLGAESQRLSRYTGLAFLGAIGVVVSSYFIVDSATTIATEAGISKLIIGATIVAFGTSIPELATSIEATRQGHLDLAFGNIIGSCFINITLILGVTLIVAQFTVRLAVFSDLVMFSLIANLFLWYFLSSDRLGRREASVLLFIYFLFLFISISGYRP